MRITHRDVRLIRDMVLSHLLSRDQIIGLRYFNSVARANSRLRSLVALKLVDRLATPFFGQSLYIATRRSVEIVGDKISPLLGSRAGSPRFVQHALTVTDVRIALQVKTGGEWRFEQQLWRKCDRFEIRPDGLLNASHPTFIEVDMGHVSAAKFKAKLRAYHALTQSTLCNELYGFTSFRLLTLTTGQLRARHLRHLMESVGGFDFRVQTVAEIGVAMINPFS